MKRSFTAVAMLALFALAGMLAACGGSFAETPAEVARNWGLLGLWRLDCGEKPSRSDPVLSYVVRNGTLYYDRDWGDGHDSIVIVSATLTSNGGIDLVGRSESMLLTLEWVSVKENDGRIRTVMNRNVNTNAYGIRDGRIVSNGNAAPLQTHCR